MLRRPFRRRRITPLPDKPPGTAPGVLTASPSSLPTQLFVIAYGPEGYVEHVCEQVDDIRRFLDVWPVVWVNVIGLGSVGIIEKVGALFDIDHLLLEDVMFPAHRPKVEYYEKHIFTILKGGQVGDHFESEHLGLLLKKNAVIVFEEKPGSSFNQVRERIRRGNGRIRATGADYLFYALLDEVIDKYFPILDHINHQLAALEEDIMTKMNRTSSQDVIQQIHNIKSDLLMMHRIVWPVSDIVSMLMREETTLIGKTTRRFMRDCYDHSIQANELTQFYRDMAAGLLNTFLAYEGHKTNDIIKVLTMVSAIFIPLNFIAGVYGMNFHTDRSPFNMPELNWYFGYPFALALMLLVALGILVLFQRRGWLESFKKRKSDHSRS